MAARKLAFSLTGRCVMIARHCNPGPIFSHKRCFGVRVRRGRTRDRYAHTVCCGAWKVFVGGALRLQPLINSLLSLE